MRLAALQSVMNTEAAKLSGYLAPTMALLFPTDLRRVTSVPAPALLRARVHPLRRFTSPTEYVTAPNLPVPVASSEHLPWGLAPNRDNTSRSPLIGEFPKLTFVPPTAFLTLSTVCSSSNLAGLFHPTATSGIHFPGVFLATQPTHLVDTPSPHAD